MPIEVKVKLGIPYCDMVGVKQLIINLESQLTTVSDVISELYKKYPDFKNKLAGNNLFRNESLEALVVVNNKLLNDKREWSDAIVGNGAEVKLFMPFSGG